MALVSSFAVHRVAIDKGSLVTAVLLRSNWQNTAFTQGRHFAPRADRVSPWFRAESGTHSARWWCDSSGIEKTLKEVFASKMQTVVADTLVNFKEYCESLPKRESDFGAMSLYKMPYFVQELDPCFSMVSGCNWIQRMVGGVCEAVPWFVF